MPSFRYKHGDRPLDGYTIQRGVGRGGFGEVYYAVSDSGREVALKIIQGYEQIELRGVSQCMNLKSPNLVSIFDVRHNPDGVPFVIMEYVAGPSLRELIDQQPAGLGIQKAAFFLREIGKGLTFLHDCGIVHRDLKPGNIFYENGYVKIGDYGLSKAMSASQHSGQTMTVGTVHYMAPEIGLGKYDRSIDIYAMGAVLYEMITGQVPYLGASPGEILMKHMSSEPNVQGIEEPFATVIKRAMAKDPAQRFQTVQEMVEAVFGAEHVRDSLSGFSPGDLSMVAGRVAQRIAVGVGGSSGPAMPPAPPVQPDSWQQAAFADRPNRMAGLATPPPLPIPQLPPPVPPARPAAGASPAPRIQPDTIPTQQRYILAGIGIFVVALAAGGFSSDFFPGMYFSLAAMAGALIGMLVGKQFILPKVPPHQGFLARIAIGGPAALFGLVLAAPAFLIASPPEAGQLGRTWCALILPIAILNWIKWIGPHRVKRVSLAVAFTAGAFAWVMTWFTGGSAELAMAVLGGIGLACGVMFPWEPRMFVPADPAPANNPTPLPAGLLAGLREPRPTAFAAAPRPAPRPFAGSFVAAREVPDWARWIWRGGMALLIALGPVLVAAAESNDRGFNDPGFAAMRAIGVGMIVLGVLCFLQSFRRRITGWWSYLLKPLVLFICLQAILVSAFELGVRSVSDDAQQFGIFFIIFPAITFLTVLFVKTKPPQPRPIPGYQPFPPNLPPAPAAAENSPSSSAHFEQAVQQALPSFAPAPNIGKPNQPRPQKLHILANLIGWALHTLTFFVAMAVVLDLPGFISAGLLDQRLADDLNRNLGDNWARLAHLQGYILVYIGAFAATLFLMLARRSQGIAHMLRPIFAAACFLVATVMLDHGLNGHWKPLAPPPAVQTPDTPNIPTINGRHAQVTDAITQYLDAAQAKMAIISLFLALAGLTLLLWPAQPPRLEQKTDREEGAA